MHDDFIRGGLSRRLRVGPECPVTDIRKIFQDSAKTSSKTRVLWRKAVLLGILVAPTGRVSWYTKFYRYSLRRRLIPMRKYASGGSSVGPSYFSEASPLSTL